MKLRRIKGEYPKYYDKITKSSNYKGNKSFWLDEGKDKNEI